MQHRTDWRLCPVVFGRINGLLGPLQVDLFASRLTHQLPNYVSWHPDPGAIACDAFAQDWSLHHTTNYKEPRLLSAPLNN